MPRIFFSHIAAFAIRLVPSSADAASAAITSSRYAGVKAQGLAGIVFDDLNSTVFQALCGSGCLPSG